MYNGDYKLAESTAARRRVHLHCVDATDGITPELGEAGGQPQLSKNGGAWANTSATLTAVGNGGYYVELTTGEFDTLGKFRVRYKSANTAEAMAFGQVVAYDPFSASNLGLSNLDGAITAIPAAVWAALTSGLVTAGSIGKKLADWVLGSDSKVLLSSTEPNVLADALLARDLGSAPGALNERTVRAAFRAIRNKSSIAAGVLTVTKEDDATPAWTAAVATDPAAQPITGVDPV